MMFKNLLLHVRLLVFSPILAMPCEPVFAHAVVTHSSLSVDHIAPHQSARVRLTFNSRVELDLSQIFLVSAGDKMKLVNAAYGDQPGLVIIDIPPLSPGEYALKLSIFAADGHLSEDIVRFHVNEKDE